MTEGAIYKKIVRRGITLVFLGLVYNGLLSFEFDHLRCASVLARIGLGWMFAALLFVRFGWKVRAGITAFILVGYWLAMAFVPVPDAGGAGSFTLEGNLVGYIDRLFLPGRLHEIVFDPEGLFSMWRPDCLWYWHLYYCPEYTAAVPPGPCADSSLFPLPMSPHVPG